MSLQRLGYLLDDLDVGLCAFDAEDRALAWNRTFLAFFPEHDGHVQVGETYRENLLRFYATRLTPEEMPHIEEHVARGIARHQAQHRPFEFAHRGVGLRVTAQTVPGLGRLRLWRRTDQSPAHHGAPVLLAPGNETVSYGDAAPDGVASLNADGRITATNREFERLYGLAPEAAFGLTFEEVVACAWGHARGAAPDHFAQHVRPHLQEALRFPGSPFELALPEDRWVRVIEHVRADAARTSVHFDITPLKREQASLRAAEASLREKTKILDAAMATMDQGLLMVDAAGIVRVCNARARQLLDLPEALMSRRPTFPEVTAFQFARGDFAGADSTLQAAAKAGDLRPHASTYERGGLNGTVLEIRTVPLPAGGWVRTYTDITERKQAEMRIALSEERLAHAIEASTDGLVDADLTTGEAWIADRWWRILGYEPGDLAPHLHTWHGLLHPEDREVATRALEAHYEGRTPTFEGEYRLRRKDGTWCWVAARGQAVRRAADGTPLRYVGTHTDISARKAVEIQIAHMAHHDPLTGLPNRTLFRERLDQALARSARTGAAIAVLACDLDYFKTINDTLGHPAGDALLRVIGQRMSAILRPCDTVARLGGDEFAIVVSHLDEPLAAAYLAQRLIETASQPVVLEGHRIEVGLSIGFAEGTAADADADILFKRADIALYEAKAAGRNIFREFEPQAGARATIQGQLALDMKDALRRGDFRLVYQPVIDIASGRVMSFEALLRWAHPVHGEISPADFIPLAEETGLIAQMGAHVLREACREAARWPDEVRVAVNLSVVQLRHEGVEREVLQALTAARLVPRRLKLEVTESVLVQEAETALVRLRRIKDMGVRVVLDDFGTGYSSLSYLRRFPFDKIKLDRSFIADIANEDTAAIVRAVVGIGERLGMGIVAEGVETAEQLERVRREGCGEVQGYYYSRPMPACEVLAYIRAHNSPTFHEKADRLSA